MNINNTKNSQSFKSISLNPLSKALYTLQHNDMLNAAAIDVFAMDTPRTFIEFKNRGKNAGIEMAFREYTGTFIAEFSAIVFALLTSKIFNKKYKKDVEINPYSWASNSSIDTFREIYDSSDKTPEGFVKKTLESMTGLAGKNKEKLSENQINSLSESMTRLIKEPLEKKEAKKLEGEIEDSIIRVLKSDNNISLNSNGKNFSANLSHVIRDMKDLGKNVFFNKEADINAALSKLKTLNKARIGIAIPISMILAITNQYINRKITKARVGIDNFVGENDYEKNVKNQNEKKNQKGLIAKKIISAGVFLFMLSKVMGIKKPEDIISKLEFNGPATGGNAIKTVYGTLILGRIFASKDSTELRETNTRDYLGFLNWLVFGGFAAKGAANVLDKNKENLFNIQKEGKGVKHWLGDLSLKSQKEIIAQGGNIKKNLRNLNIAQITGIAWSAVALGIWLPKLNIWLTKRGNKDKNKNINDTALKNYTMQSFLQNMKKSL